MEWRDLGLALLGMVGAGILVLLAAIGTGLGVDVGRPAIQVALWSLVCGLAGYLLYGLGLPGTGFLEGLAPGIRGLVIGFCCGLVPLVAVAWLAVREATAR